MTTIDLNQIMIDVTKENNFTLLDMDDFSKECMIKLLKDLVGEDNLKIENNKVFINGF